MKDDVERVILLTNVAVNIPLALTSVIGNSMVLHAIRKTPSLRSPLTFLICGLALSDLAVGTLVQPFFIADILVQLYVQSQGFKHTFRRCYNTVGFYLCGVSLCTIACISIDRLIAVQKPLRYPSIVTKYRISRLLLAIWSISLLLASSQFWEERLLFASIASVVSISLIVSTISHVKMYKIVRRHQAEIGVQLQAVENSLTTINMKSLHKSTFNAFIVFVVLFVCYFPYLVVYIVTSGSRNNSATVARSLSSTVVFTNSALNPIVYCWRLRKIRKVVVRIIYDMCRVIKR